MSKDVQYFQQQQQIKTKIQRHFCLIHSPILYVGQSNHGLYAIPSLVDEFTSTFAASHTSRLLIEGPSDDDETKASKTEQKRRLNVNVRLPPETYYTPGSSVNSPRPSIRLFGSYFLILIYIRNCHEVNLMIYDLYDF